MLPAASIAPCVWRQQGQALIQFSSIARTAGSGSAWAPPTACANPSAAASSGTRAPASARRAARTPAADASPTWSDLPSVPNAARIPAAPSRAMATAEPFCSGVEPHEPRRRGGRPHATAGRGGMDAAVVQGRVAQAREAPIASNPAAYAFSTSPMLRPRSAPTTSAAGAVGALRWAMPGR